MATFNPTLQANVSFEQPVQQPDVFGAIGNVLQGLGVIGQQRTERTLTQDERHDATFRRWLEAEGRNVSVADLTPSDFRSLESFGGPSFSNHLRTISEDMGGQGTVQARSARDEIVDWTTSDPQGRLIAGQAAQLYPDNPGMQETLILRGFAEESARQARHVQLQREAEETGYNTTIERRIWDLERASFSNYASVTANGLAEIYSRISAGNAVTLSNISPEFVAIYGEDIRITPDNFTIVMQTLRQRVVTDLIGTIRGAHNNEIAAPNEDYISEVLAPFDNMVTAINEGIDPVKLLARTQAQTTLRVNQTLIDNGHRGLLDALSLAGTLPPLLGQTIIAGLMEDIDAAVESVVRNPTAVTPESAARLSASQRETSASIITAELSSAAAGQGDYTFSTATRFVDRLRSYINLVQVDGQRLNPSFYREVLSNNVLDILGMADEDPGVVITDFITSDMGLEIDHLRSLAQSIEGSLSVVNGRVAFVPSTLISDMGTTLGPRTLGREGQELLTRINEKLGILSNSRTTPQGLVDSLLTDLDVSRPTESGPGAARTDLVPRVEQPPERTYGVRTTPGMNPIFTMEGASTMTQPYAQERMTEMLAGPFENLQSIFGRQLRINDGIAREGTSRERETPGSRHFHGDALDIDISQMNDIDRMNLVEAAMEAGFQGFGFGNGILHIDLGARRSWNYNITEFAGMAIADIQAMVNSGTVPRPNIGGSDNPTFNNPSVAHMASASMAQEASGQMEWDQGEGQARDLSIVQPTQQDMRTGTPTPEEVRQRNTTSEVGGGTTPVISQDIASLIDALTGGGMTEEEIVDLLRRAQNDR